MKKHTLAVALVVALSAPSLSVASPSSVPATVAEAEVGWAVGDTASRVLTHLRVRHNSERMKRGCSRVGAAVGGVIGFLAGGWTGMAVGRAVGAA